MPTLDPTVIWYLIIAGFVFGTAYVIFPIVQYLVKNKVMPPTEEVQKIIAVRMQSLQILFEVALQVVRYLEQMGKMKSLTNAEKKAQAKVLVKQTLATLKLSLFADKAAEDMAIDMAIEAAVNFMNKDKTPAPVITVVSPVLPTEPPVLPDVGR